MTKKNKIRQLSANNNCLSAETINSFLNGELNSQEMELVRKHIDECEFCADAVEGYKNMQLKDSLLNTVEQLNKKIDKGSVQREYKLQSFTKKIIAYSSLAASVLILAGLFLLINNLKIRRSTIVSDKLVMEEDKQPSQENREQIEKSGSLVIYDSFPGDADNRIKTAPKKEIVPVESKSDYKLNEKSGTKKIMEQEVIAGIPEAEADKEIDIDMEAEKVEYQVPEVVAAPAARSAEVSKHSMYDKSTGRNKAMLTKKEYPQAHEILTTQMQSDKGLVYDETLPLILDEVPRFEKNGLEHFKEYIQKNLQYPQRAKKLRIEGEVFVKFAIDTTGRVVDTEIINSADSLLNKEALRVINSSPAWTAGRQDGKPVKVSYVIPVVFKIDY
jgi:TonB family protein